MEPPSKERTPQTSSSVAADEKPAPLAPPTSAREKRFSVPRQFNERRVVVRPYESFRERGSIASQSTIKRAITYGYASLNADQGSQEEINGEAPAPIFSIYGDEPSSSTNVSIEQPVGAEADNFIAGLSDKQKVQLKKFLEHTPPQENQYFVWIKDVGGDKITIISMKTLENHLKSNKKVQRVKWRHLSTERVSIYRYSLPALTYQKSKACGDCILRHKKICLIFIWLAFVLFLCVVVLLGSINHDESSHPYIHLRTNLTAP